MAAAPLGPDEVEPHVDALRLAGWRAIAVGRDEDVPRAWAVLTAATVGERAMTRRRWRITVLAALATLAAVYPITSLFTSARWLPEAMLVIGLTAALGLLLRGLTRSRLLIVLVQLVVVLYVVLLRFTGDTFNCSIPGADRRGGQLARARGQSRRSSAARPSASPTGSPSTSSPPSLSSPCSSTRWRRPGVRRLPQGSPC